ncbi:cell wall-binding protein [Bacillus pseudomycoides]|uniref:N-acetylmuramoyl-L-alanine amidase family protein n=3 Tax=Bacillus pseudomycoides TaxID=64104 RepID=UPI0001A14B6F|nr:cell wall-binding protein [Bacillus pseudomycoides]EEM07838.1 cell wall binding repeat-containing protein [Bacillus pseudomycoides]PEK29210.1 cell wall-binding protein [Bacillus pseudomycoides]PEK58197.1 cell wall-binding protein [Bacillus pseudomycoides]PEO38401.1 cell wall-binding protein [Bacillus pseudomycoides]PEP35915.1 cell wall-binding protein [Bacillus pseudomycoides]
MKKKFKTNGIGKRVIPATAALGILFSMAPIAENKASAGIGAVVDIGITVLGAIANTYETLGISPGDRDPGTHIDVYAENETYQAPSFTSGEFNISMYHTKGDLNFIKQVKVRYPNGRIETHQLKSGQQLKITDAGAIIDLNPNAANVSEHDLLYITQAQLDEGKTGVVINQGQHAFVEKASGKNPRFLGPLYKKYSGDSFGDWTVIARNSDYLFDQIANKLSDKQKQLITLTSKPVSKDVLDNYVNNDPKARADFYDRLSDVLAERTNVIETGLLLPFIRLNDGKPYQIIPYKKGTNKVIVKTGSKYLSGKEGNELQYSDSLGDDEVFELVQIENSDAGTVQFRLNNKNGVSLAGDRDTSKFGTGERFYSEIRFDDKSNNEIHNWLIEWYPGKENERQKYDEVQFVADEKDSTKLIAKDSSGNVIKNSWVNQGSAYHFADADGVLMTGWQDIKGKTYYFDPSNGELATERNKNGVRIEGKFYTFNDSGALQRSAWSKSGYDGRSYSDASGALVENGLREIDGEIYYFGGCVVLKDEIRLEDRGVILHFSDKGVLERVSNLNGEVIDSVVNVKFDNKILTFNHDGSIFKTGINKREKIVEYYSLEDGPLYTGWKIIDGKNYYFTNGRNYTFNDYDNIDGKKYYFHEDGSVNKAGFEKIDGKLYHFDNNGVAQKGWQTIENKYYYFDENGAAKTGWFNVGGGYRPFPLAYGYLWYCAREDGSLYSDGWFKIDGKDYHFDYWGHKM